MAIPQLELADSSLFFLSTVSDVGWWDLRLPLPWSSSLQGYGHKSNPSIIASTIVVLSGLRTRKSYLKASMQFILLLKKILQIIFSWFNKFDHLRSSRSLEFVQVRLKIVAPILYEVAIHNNFFGLFWFFMRLICSYQEKERQPDCISRKYTQQLRKIKERIHVKEGACFLGIFPYITN